jgi:hypothetical protein
VTLLRTWTIVTICDFINVFKVIVYRLSWSINAGSPSTAMAWIVSISSLSLGLLVVKPEARQKPLVRWPMTDGLGEVTISGIPDYSCSRECIFTKGVKAIAVEEDVGRTKGCSRPAVKSGFATLVELCLVPMGDFNG